jgi:CheY-like chemotaxis protein
MLLNGKKFFIVEDQRANAMIVAIALQSHGGEVYIERWGARAIEHLKQHPDVDLILMDLMLTGGLSGFDVFTQLKQIPELTHIPVVAVSASDSNIAMKKAQELGFAGYISKPISYITFPETIASILGGNKVWASEPLL